MISAIRLTLRRNEDPPDDFFEFGAEDYARVMAGWNRAHKRAEAGLRTAKLREQEERERASRFPEAVQRIHFPDGFILQVSAVVSPLLLCPKVMRGSRHSTGRIPNPSFDSALQQA